MHIHMYTCTHVHIYIYIHGPLQVCSVSAIPSARTVQMQGSGNYATEKDDEDRPSPGSSRKLCRLCISRCTASRASCSDSFEVRLFLRLPEEVCPSLFVVRIVCIPISGGGAFTCFWRLLLARGQGEHPTSSYILLCILHCLFGIRLGCLEPAA